MTTILTILGHLAVAAIYFGAGFLVRHLQPAPAVPPAPTLVDTALQQWETDLLNAAKAHAASVLKAPPSPAKPPASAAPTSAAS